MGWLGEAICPGMLGSPRCMSASWETATSERFRSKDSTSAESQGGRCGWTALRCLSKWCRRSSPEDLLAELVPEHPILKATMSTLPWDKPVDNAANQNLLKSARHAEGPLSNLGPTQVCAREAFRNRKAARLFLAATLLGSISQDRKCEKS